MVPRATRRASAPTSSRQRWRGVRDDPGPRLRRPQGGGARARAVGAADGRGAAWPAGAEVVAWDDGAAARAKAAADGIALADLTRAQAWEGVKALIVSPGIPHLYPAPHPAVAAAWDAGVAVDNDIGLFFRSFATPAWDSFDRVPQVVGITGSNGKSTTTALLGARAGGAPGGRCRSAATSAAACSTSIRPRTAWSWCWSSRPTRSSWRGRCSPTSRSSSTSRRTISTGTAAWAAISRPSGGSSPRAGRRGRSSASTRTRGGSSPTPCARRRGRGDPVITVSVTRKPGGPGWEVFARKGFLAEWRGGRQMASIDLRGMRDAAGRAQPPERLRRLCRGAEPRARAAADRGGARELPGAAAPQPARSRPGAGCGSSTIRKATNADAAEKALLSLRAHPLDRRRAAEGGRHRARCGRCSRGSPRPT